MINSQFIDTLVTQSFMCSRVRPWPVTGHRCRKTLRRMAMAEPEIAARTGPSPAADDIRSTRTNQSFRRRPVPPPPPPPPPVSPKSHSTRSPSHAHPSRRHDVTTANSTAARATDPKRHLDRDRRGGGVDKCRLSHGHVT